MKIMNIGIMPFDQYRKRAAAIARGTYKSKPGEPKIWFESIRSLAEVLSDENRALLGVIRDTRPDSLADLAARTGRKTSNLSRTLKTLSRYGIVELERHDRQVRPIVKADRFRIVTEAA